MCFKYLLFFSVGLFISCDKEGLNPNSITEPGFGGTITFQSKIPPSETIEDIRVVAVPYQTIDTSVSLLIQNILQGLIPYSASLNVKVDSGSTIHYELFVNPKTYYYVGVVQRYGGNYFHDWKVISVYGFSHLNLTPTPIVIKDEVFINGIDFVVDYNNLPPQPFTGP